MLPMFESLPWQVQTKVDLELYQEMVVQSMSDQAEF
jgi:hypothetical protein